MPNHFHLLIYIHQEEAATKFLRAVCGAYTIFYNKKYNRVGPLFQGTYKASLIDRDDYLLYITRYIHRNPTDYKEWKYSSTHVYLDK